MNLMKKWRLESGHTFEEMAARCGASQSHVFNASAGRVGISEELAIRIHEMMEREAKIKANVPDRIIIEHEINMIKKHNVALSANKALAKRIETWWSLEVKVSKIPGSKYDGKIKEIKEAIEKLGLEVEYDENKWASNEKCLDCGGSGADESKEDFCRTCRGKGYERHDKQSPLVNELKQELEQLKAAFLKVSQDNDRFRMVNIQNETAKRKLKKREKEIQEITNERNRTVQELSKIDPAKLRRHTENEALIAEALPIIDGVWTSNAGKLSKIFKVKYSERFIEHGIR